VSVAIRNNLAIFVFITADYKFWLLVLGTTILEPILCANHPLSGEICFANVFETFLFCHLNHE
jgi:hypothetical protein